MTRLFFAGLLACAVVVAANAAAGTRWAAPLGVVAVLYAVGFCFVEARPEWNFFTVWERRKKRRAV